MRLSQPPQEPPWTKKYLLQPRGSLRLGQRLGLGVFLPLQDSVLQIPCSTSSAPDTVPSRTRLSSITWLILSLFTTAFPPPFTPLPGAVGLPGATKRQREGDPGVPTPGLPTPPPQIPSAPPHAHTPASGTLPPLRSSSKRRGAGLRAWTSRVRVPSAADQRACGASGHEAGPCPSFLPGEMGTPRLGAGAAGEVAGKAQSQPPPPLFLEDSDLGSR